MSTLTKETTLLLLVALRGALQTSVSQQNVLVISTSTKTKLNESFTQKLIQDIKTNPEKYSPEAQKIGNGRLIITKLTTVFTSELETKLEKYIEKFETRTKGWNI